MGFGAFVKSRHAAGRLVVQPRLGLGDPAQMRDALIRVKAADATTVGTVTLDSYTRVRDHDAARRALRDGMDLNGYPLIAHGPDVTRRMLEGVAGPDFPVQVRHGSARPSDIVEVMCAAGVTATEGGPVSYCLPYGRTGLDEALRDWNRTCEILAATRETGAEPHLETFGGCMMGQLCPPSLLVAISVLEALYFRSFGLTSVSVSYAQQTNPEQDREAVAALHRLCRTLIPDLDYHVVIYAYMGVFPRTPGGARELLASAARLAVETGAQRLIVKTIAEAFHIPTVQENIEALELAADVAAAAGDERPPADPGATADSEVYQEAYALVEAVLNCGPNAGRALVTAFKRGLLDVPYCLHPDNAGRARGYLDADGRLRWATIGAMPLRALVGRDRSDAVTATGLLTALSHVQQSFDLAQLDGAHPAIDAGPTQRRD
ncbi:MAG TPA: methylaspartate mutase [Actinocrinis sp.]|nr:methylaspartate mutase [Actinocrinis sp.]